MHAFSCLSAPRYLQTSAHGVALPSPLIPSALGSPTLQLTPDPPPSLRLPIILRFGAELGYQSTSRRFFIFSKKPLWLSTRSNQFLSNQGQERPSLERNQTWKQIDPGTTQPPKTTNCPQSGLSHKAIQSYDNRSP